MQKLVKKMDKDKIIKSVPLWRDLLGAICGFLAGMATIFCGCIATEGSTAAFVAEGGAECAR